MLGLAALPGWIDRLRIVQHGDLFDETAFKVQSLEFRTTILQKHDESVELNSAALQKSWLPAADRGRCGACIHT